jgi:D-3-phosphoglycerate dehydrogenase
VRILNIEPSNYSESARAEIEKLGEVIETHGSREDLLRLLPDFEVLIVRLGHKIDREVLEKGKRLKAIVTATTGLNHIDTEAAEKLGIRILSLKGETAFLRNVTATAELTWGLILNLMRKIPEAHNHVVSGGWQRDLFRGKDLKNRALGVVGYGRLGKIVAEYGKAFRMRILATDPHAQSAPRWVRLFSLESLLRDADIVSLHVSLSPETVRFFGREEFRSMKPGAFFINTSRGELVDEEALLEALRSKKLGGAALDVLSGETSGTPGWLKAHPLRKYAEVSENLILTPHVGGGTEDSMAETELFMARKLTDLLKRSDERS